MKSTASKKNYSFIIMMMFSLTLVCAQAPVLPSNGTPNEEGQTINPVIGDISFVSKFGYQPDATTDENLRIRTHFDYVENLLRQKDISGLSPEMQLRRQHMIDLFHEYAVAGAYPHNYDFKDQRKPCFIDRDNIICAVGYLVEQTVGREVAENINATHQYDDVLAMNDKFIDNWIEGTGLSKEEVAMIQPTYGGGFPPCWPNSTPPLLECKGNKLSECIFSCCTLQWECKCVPPSQYNGNTGIDPGPCGGKGNNGNGNNGMAQNMTGLYAQFILQYFQAIL